MSALTWLAHLAKPGERRPMIVVECVVNDIDYAKLLIMDMKVSMIQTS